MSCEELRRDAGGLAALAAGDPERDAAFAHARSCPRCAAALRQGERLVALLDALPPEPVPHGAFRRAAAPVLEDLSCTPPRLALPLAAIGAAALVVLAARSHSTAPRDWLAAGVLALAAAGVAASAGRGTTAALAAAAISVLFAVVAGAAGAPHLSEGLKCAATELVAAAIPVVAVLAVLRRRGVTPGKLSAAAAAGALAGQGALEIICHAPDAVAHLLPFHSGAVIVAAMLGVVPWRRLARRPHLA